MSLQKHAYQFAYHTLQSAADSGNPKAQTSLAEFYTSTEHRFHNSDLALHWYKKAANQGEYTASLKLARYYYFKTKPDINSTIQYLKHAAKNLPIAKTQLAYIYEQTQHSQLNIKKSLQLYHEAARKGEKHAQYRLGSHYEMGTNLPRNLANAHYWYLKSAKSGMPCAQKAIGDLYSNGSYLRYNLAKARYWHHKAAKYFSHLQAIKNMLPKNQHWISIRKTVLTNFKYNAINEFCNVTHIFSD